MVSLDVWNQGTAREGDAKCEKWLTFSGDPGRRKIEIRGDFLGTSWCVDAGDGRGGLGLHNFRWSVGEGVSGYADRCFVYSTGKSRNSGVAGGEDCRSALESGEFCREINSGRV